MEELWKDIHFTSLPENPTTTTTSSNCATASIGLGPPPAVVSLSLSTSDHRKDDDQQVLISNVISTPCFMSSLNSPFEALAVASSSALASSSSPSLLLSSCLRSKNKRDSEDLNGDQNESVGDRRHKRMMKNRESAARSRARRQAYTSELEMEMAQLMEENAKLKEQQGKLMISAAPEIPKKGTHIRSLTAPF